MGSSDYAAVVTAKGGVLVSESKSEQTNRVTVVQPLDFLNITIDRKRQVSYLVIFAIVEMAI